MAVSHAILKRQTIDTNASLTVFILIYTLLTVLPCCDGSLTEYLPLHIDGQTKEEIIEAYFHFGFTYAEILGFLHLYHSINLGYRQLQRILRASGLRRSVGQSDSGEIIDAIEKELSGSGKDLGYRSMHARIQQKYNVVVSRQSVRIILKHLDPERVQYRRQRRLNRREYFVRGPNHLWHIDGWDKLKQFGLCVHSCIDGYSRRIMWLEVSSTNNNPYVICKYFSECVKQLNGLPCQVRADRGTENVNVEIMQTVLRSLNEDLTGTSLTSFLYGKSTANQRIESWWSKFGLYGMTTWINQFKGLADIGIIDTSKELDIQCILFCYLPLLRTELQTIAQLWNTHYIRKSRNETSPHGRPDSMYFMPEFYSGTDLLKPINPLYMRTLSDLLASNPPCCQDHYRELFCLIMDESDCVLPKTLNEAQCLLVHLLDTVNSELEM